MYDKRKDEIDKLKPRPRIGKCQTHLISEFEVSLEFPLLLGLCWSQESYQPQCKDNPHTLHRTLAPHSRNALKLLETVKISLLFSSDFDPDRTAAPPTQTKQSLLSLRQCCRPDEKFPCAGVSARNVPTDVCYCFALTFFLSLSHWVGL